MKLRFEEGRQPIRGSMSPARGPVLFAGPGEMAARCREFDWAATALGPTSDWSQSLRTMADAVLASRSPMLLFWGPELVQIYNDAFRPSLGSSTGPHARHPRALGMGAAEFWTDVWEVIGPQIQGVMSRGEAVWFENVHLPIERDGRLDDAWWTYSYSPVRDDDGRINGTLVVCLETTSAVRAGREIETHRVRVANLLQQMTDAYIGVDAEFRIVEANVATERRVNVPRDRLIGRSIWDAFPGFVGSEWETLYRRVVAERVDLHQTRTYSDGRVELVAEVDVYPTVDGGFAVFWRDVSDRERATQERERLLRETEDARRAAEAANRSKGDFLAMMSHELRTPLNAIGGYTDLIEMGVHGPVTAEQREALGRIQSSQRHLLGLINGALNYAKIDAGALHYAVEDVPLDEILRTCEALIAPQARSKALELRVPTCPPDVVARADREKVRQVVLNLLSNAVKFTDAGWIALECSREGDGTVALRVSDTGHGIAANRLDAVFQPFVQIDAKLTRVQEGVGLGLAISRDLAHGMGGDLTATSEPGRGSCFTLTLPEAVHL